MSKEERGNLEDAGPCLSEAPLSAAEAGGAAGGRPDGTIPANAGLLEISDIAHRIKELEARQEQLKKEQTDLTTELWRLTVDALPSRMAELGLSSFTLEDNSKITLATVVNGTWPKEGKEHQDAIKWMEEHGFDDLIKNTVAVAFGKGERSRASELVALLDQGGFTNWKRDESVHYQTLRAWLKEQISLGKEVPFDLFHAECFTQAKIKAPKT